uniref:Separase-like TPR repeats region domain-containing protein n=1 Tax=Oryza punctata TaxID=4537 RepID=A0A0E0K5Q9_ORYPU
MEAAAADLLAALSSPSSHAGLRSRFVAYLEPFSPYLPTQNPSAKPPPKRTAKQTKQRQQQQPPPDAATVRPLAKRFLPFLCRALQVLPPLLRPNPSSGDAGCTDELLDVYALLLDCLAVISACLVGKPYSVLLQRGRFVCCLESRGHYARAEADAAATLDSLRSALSVPTASKSRRAASVASLLPDPGISGEAGADPEITILAIELTVCFANCASKGKVKEAAPYERVVSLVDQLQPWLRILAEDVSRKYLTLLAPKVLELCCQTVWVHARLSYHRLSASQEGQRIIEDILKDTSKDIIMDAFAKIAKMVALLHELIGNGAEAEVLLRTGKDISHFQGLPVFGITFTSALGQIYRKRQQWDAAESELKYAKDLLAQNATFISCKLCKLTLDISLDVQAGDLFWSLYEKDFQKQSPDNLSNALGMYQSALDKLNRTKLEFPVDSYDKLKTTCIACSKDGKEPLAANDGVLPSCTVCANFSQASGDYSNEFMALKFQKHKDSEGCPPLDVKVKRTTRNSSRLAKEQNVEAHVKTRTRSSKRTAHVKGEKASTELHCKNGISCSDNLSTDTLVHGKANCILDGVDQSIGYTCNIFGCWNCLFVNSLNSGSIQNILQFRWDCVWHHNHQKPWVLMEDCTELIKFIISIGSAYHHCILDPFLRIVIELMSIIYLD